MKTKPFYPLALLALLSFISGPFAKGATILVNWQTNPGYELKDQAGVALTGGKPNVTGDGAVLELGYYSLSSVTTPFAGQWIPLPGDFASGTTIGEKMMGNGIFDINTEFDSESDPSILGVVGHPLSVRFFDQVPGVPATFYNVVSSASWVMPTPNANDLTIVTVNLSSPSSTPLLWQGGPDSAFRTVIPIPEPSSLLLIGLSAVGLFSRRRNPA
jgi:hypothetical protein